MSEDEIIEIIKNEITNTYSEVKAKALQGLLDLYQKLKEENQKLDEKFKYAVPDEIVDELYISKNKIREILDKEREKAKERHSNKNVLKSIYKKEVQISMIDTIKKKLLEE